ncbi:MAG TPA: N-acetylmuramoyl-L-alanine amidase [Bacteroidia bacterium]|jgi:N-acetylmuramoyl-L-alanine amidase|nr:N-acetylmuramoyl-L-alanine amidase [Bacteroidia bacterium]
MYKKATYIFIFCTVLLTLGFGPPRSQGDKKQWVIVIDPGHGGKDPGCHGEKFKEKNIALAVSLKLGHYLEDNDKNVKVVYTRTTDVFVPLNERADIANKNHADVFICVHLNASPNHDASGSATYVMAERKSGGNLEVEKQENSAILYEKDYKTTYAGFDPNSKEANIIFNMYQNLYLTQSLDLSSKIQEEYSHVEKRKDNGVKQAGFLVLWKTAMPSLLTEIGFLTNPDEEKFMGSQKGEDEIAKSIFLAFEQYKSEKENSTYDPKTFNFKEYVIQTADTTSSPADTASQNKVMKDTTHVEVKHETVKDTTKPKTIHSSPDSNWHRRIPQPPKYKDTTKKTAVVHPDTSRAKVNKMKDAVKGLHPDTVMPAKKAADTIIIPPKKHIDTAAIKKQEPPHKKVTDSVIPPKKHTDTAAIKKTEPPHKKIIDADTSTVYYKVQFALSDHELPKTDKRFADLPDVDFYMVDKVYKYTAGKFTELKDAIDLQSKLRDKGYKDAFVVAFKGKQRVTIKKASGK